LKPPFNRLKKDKDKDKEKEKETKNVIRASFTS